MVLVRYAVELPDDVVECFSVRSLFQTTSLDMNNFIVPMWDALVPILWRSIPGRTSWDGVLPTLQQEARQLKAAVRLTCQKMGSNTRFSHFKEAFKGLTPAVTPARMVWLVLWEMLGRRVQILHCLGNYWQQAFTTDLSCPRAAAAHKTPAPLYHCGPTVCGTCVLRATLTSCAP